MIRAEKIKETIAGLKDFQLKTVDYVFEQLYGKGRSKMLIADEVGLGKTIVAKGIIAKAFEKKQKEKTQEQFNVIYICSNLALARQNLKKLNFSGDNLAIDYSEEDDRLTSLAYISAKEEKQFPLRIKAFTPATSFDDKTHAGKADERILLYRLLNSYSDIQEYSNSLKWILKGSRRMGDDNWENRIRWATQADEREDYSWVRKIRPKVYSEFRKFLEQKVKPADLPRSFAAAGLTYEVKYWTLLKNLCRLEIRRNNYYHYNFCKELISSLRFGLSRACLEFLHADIFILDEFQRYKQLIENSTKNEEDKDEDVSPAIQLARDIFSFDGPKTLMLSATPFKPYTNDFDELNNEVHYNEFKTVLQFLMAEKSELFWKEYEKDRRAFFSLLRHPDKLKEKMPEALLLKEKLETLYRTGMVRTEKLLASKDKDALITRTHNEPIVVQPEDIHDFIVLDQITQVLNKEHKASLAVPIEYVKSCPYPLSFLDNYQHKEKIRSLVLQENGLRGLLRKTKHGWLNLEILNDYKPLIATSGKTLPNAKLRLLLNETVLNNGWKYLWIPPSVPYYEFGGAYKDSNGYSKTLIFSSWKMVPRMISSLVSYEAERLSIGNSKSISAKEKREVGGGKRYYFQKKKGRHPRPQFTFKVEKEDSEPQQMNNFILAYPALYLTQLYDPAQNLGQKISVQEIKNELKRKLIAEFHSRNLNSCVTGKGDWQKWFWIAPLVLDKNASDSSLIEKWFLKGMPPSELSIDADSLDIDKAETTGRSKHFQHAKESFFSDTPIEAGRLNEQQIEIICEHLAELTIASPAICYLRSQLRYKEKSLEAFDAAYNTASAFLTMFNKAESIAVVRLHTEETEYWQRVLKYMIDGNIQAMLDEFLYLLINGENIQSVAELSDFISDILSVRTATTDVEDLSLFLENLSKDKKKKKGIRSHYAVDFGSQKMSTAKGAGRQINIRQAFNSPFRPFVLATTSIGQEGLDFHFYCKKIFHWNLPSNPIDFEQREGRIHRYQGLVIRQNLAEKYKDDVKLIDAKRNVWTEIFQIASQEKATAHFPCDLVPFWHTEPKTNIKIERIVPLYPFSKDIEKFSNLIKVLAFYRLTFGQPRQDELVDALGSEFSPEQIGEIDELIISLSPITYRN